MNRITLGVFMTVIGSGLATSIKAKVEDRVAFFGEDVHIPVPSLHSSEVLFIPREKSRSEVLLLRNGTLENSRAKLVGPHGNFILEDVGEEDEGTYVVKNLQAPADIRRIMLIVRDCATETAVKYGETYQIQIHDVTGPITLEFRPSQTNTNDTAEPPATVLLDRTSTPVDEYLGRLNIKDWTITLHSVTGADEGSYTVVDVDGKVRKKTCLNVKEHQNFVKLQYGETLKINLYLDYDKVNLVYSPESNNKEQVILDQGVLTAPLDPALDGRISVDGHICYLKRVQAKDRGVFRVTDLTGFHVSNVHIDVEAYKLPHLYVAILSMVSLVAFLLLVCLVSCLIKVHRRAEKARKIALIAQQAGKGDGEAFRQVVHEAYTRFTEESTLQSTWDNTTESTEVEIKGLEVSKPGRYHVLPNDNNLLEMSDSGVEFNSSALPLDSDTDMPPAYPSHKLCVDSTATPPAITEGDLSASHTPDSFLSASPVTKPKSDGQPSEDFLGTIIPEITQPEVPAAPVTAATPMLEMNKDSMAPADTGSGNTTT